MRKNLFGITTIEILVIVGILGLMLSVSAKSYRSYLEAIDVNNTNNDFDNVVEYLGRELLEIKESLDQYPEDKKDSLSQGLDSIQEWAHLINSEIDLKTDNVFLTLLLLCFKLISISVRMESCSLLVCYGKFLTLHK